MESLRHRTNDVNQNEVAGGNDDIPNGITISVKKTKPQPIPVSPDAPPVFDHIRAFSPTPRSSHPTSLSRLSSNIYIASSCSSYHPDAQFAARFLDHLEANGQDNDWFVYKTFMKAHSCYDITPHHAKLLAVDTKMPMHKAWSYVLDSCQRSAILWDSHLERYVGMLTITDFIRVYLQEYKKDPSGERLKALTKRPVASWLKLLANTERPQELLVVSVTDCLYTAVESLCSNEIHRLPIVDAGEVVFLLTRRNVLKFLYAYLNELPCPEFMAKTPQELGIGSWNNIWTVPEYTPLVEVLRLLMDESISAVPVIYDDGNITTFAKADMIAVAAKMNFLIDLSMPVREALQLCGKSHDHLFVFATNQTLKEVVETIVENAVHCVYITDQFNEIIAAISLSDILKKIVLAPDSPSPSRSNVHLNII
uniref:5'-AMP-activated protein kinase subunit gamma-2 n=1 Tax=Steinernema glaseri TaxID=37863 RepID=A0A1I7ZQX6_9BILA